jgi:hypothetical protein
MRNKMNKINKVILKNIIQISLLVLMCMALMLEPVTIDQFKYEVVDFPLNWFMFGLLGVLFLIVTFGEGK